MNLLWNLSKSTYCSAEYTTRKGTSLGDPAGRQAVARSDEVALLRPTLMNKQDTTCLALADAPLSAWSRSISISTVGVPCDKIVDASKRRARLPIDAAFEDIYIYAQIFFFG